MESLALLLLLVSCFLASARAQYEFQTKYVDVNVDHFNFENTDTFKLRYLENNSYWNAAAGGPIFFYTGNEGDVTLFAQNTGIMWEMAPQFGALLVFAEHRYYGVSMPYGNLSLTDLKYSQYLSSSQALADYVDVLRKIRADYNVTKSNNPVILFGGSYGGMLSAWFRMKYPDESVGALASSAPIWQFPGLTPCEAFNSVVSSVFKTESDTCFNAIQQSWSIIDNITSEDDGMNWISENFKLCNPLKTKQDVQALKDWFSNIWVNLAMLNYPYPTNFISDLPGYPVKAACSQFSDGVKDTQDLLIKLVHGSGVFFNNSGEASCLDTGNANGALGNTWDLQTCTEMVMPMCSDSSSMFQPQEWDFQAYSDNCYTQYKVRPQQYLVEKMYGGRDLQYASNIIFSNGLLDPWSSGGVLFSISKSVVAVVIPESAHHLDLRASNPLDPESIRRARGYYRQTFKKWMKSHRILNNQIPVLSSIDRLNLI